MGTAPEFKTGKAGAACQEQDQVSTKRACHSLGCPLQPLLLWALNEEQRRDLEPVCAAVPFPNTEIQTLLS